MLTDITIPTITATGLINATPFVTTILTPTSAPQIYPPTIAKPTSHARCLVFPASTPPKNDRFFPPLLMTPGTVNNTACVLVYAATCVMSIWMLHGGGGWVILMRLLFGEFN